MNKIYIPYYGEHPAAVDINGHPVLIVSADPSTMAESLDLMGGDYLCEVDAEEYINDGEFDLASFVADLHMHKVGLESEMFTRFDDASSDGDTDSDEDTDGAVAGEARLESDTDTGSDRSISLNKVKQGFASRLDARVVRETRTIPGEGEQKATELETDTAKPDPAPINPISSSYTNLVVAPPAVSIERVVEQLKASLPWVQ